MNLIQIQIALFFLQDYKNNYESFSLFLKNQFGESLQTLQLPISDQEPSEIPRLTLTYSNFNINVAKNRLDIFININPTTDTIGITNTIFSIDYNSLGIEFKRLGVISTFFEEGNSSEIKNLLNPIFHSKNLSEINIRVNEKTTIRNLLCNNIEQIGLGNAQKNNGTTQQEIVGLVVQRDINSPIERINKIEQQELKSLFEEFFVLSKNRILV